MSRPKLLLVSPRPPRPDGQGDQRRAYVALESLAEDWDVEVVSWLPNAETSLARCWMTHPGCLLKTLLLSTVRPLHVAYVQSLAPRTLAQQIRTEALILYMTDRAVPFRQPPGPYVIDFIDDLGGAATRRAASSGRITAAVWRWQGRRLRQFDAKLAAGSLMSLAIGEVDAAAISPTVRTIRAAIASSPMAEVGTKIVFTGNLFYPPNLDAATWICESLAPELAKRGVPPHEIVIAGRRPPKTLCDAAQVAGVDLRADVPDQNETLREAGVVLSPVVFGSGVQNKVLDAVGAGRACVLTPFTNQALGLTDGHSALIRDRTGEAFADAIVALRTDAKLRDRLVASARDHLAPFGVEVVAQTWRRCFDEVRPVAVPMQE